MSKECCEALRKLWIWFFILNNDDENGDDCKDDLIRWSMIIDHDHDENEKIMNDNDHQIIHWMGVLTWTHEYVYDDDDEDDDDDDDDHHHDPTFSTSIAWLPWLELILPYFTLDQTRLGIALKFHRAILFHILSEIFLHLRFRLWDAELR